MTHTPALAAMMQASPSEIYLLDATTLRFVDVNQTARQRLGYDSATLARMTPLDLAPGLSPATLTALLAGLGDEVGAQVSLRTDHRCADGGTYPVTLHFLRTQRDGQPLILAMADDRSAEQAANVALEQYQARFDAIATNMPGLVYQFNAHPDGSVDFSYLSDGCQQLLGLPVAQLQQQPDLFLKLILPEDQGSYLDSMAASQANLSTWNWEGRIWVAQWNDEKWINLRATPHALLGRRGSVQWDGIMTNITASRRAQQELNAAHQRLAQLTAHIEQAKEQERTRIAREIHDDVGGNLTAIKMALSMLVRRLPDQPGVLEKAEYVDALVDRTIEAIHRIALDLRPSVLDFGLVEALAWQCNEFEQQNGTPCAFTSSARAVDLSLDRATAVFRIFQEALTNIAKHARATQVEVSLQREASGLVLAIRDDGVGIAPADRAKPQSFGLRGMAERAQALGGILAVAPGTTGGTVVTINVPFSVREQ